MQEGAHGLVAVQEAIARFSAFPAASLKNGPIVRRRGVGAAVLLPVDGWR